MNVFREFHAIGVKAGLPMEPYKDWRQYFTNESSVIWPIIKHGKMVGGFLFWHNTLHIAVDPEWQGRWITKEIIKAYWTWKHEVPVIAMIKKGDARTEKLARHFGFADGTENDEYLFLKKEPPCLQ